MTVISQILMYLKKLNDNVIRAKFISDQQNL